MPILMTALGIIASAFFYYLRARGPARMISDVVDVVGDTRASVRRFQFRRQANVHPVDSIEDPAMAIGGLAAAYITLDTLPAQDHWDRLKVELARGLNISAIDAEELMVLGRWFVEQCGTPNAAVTRLARKLYKLSGPESATAIHGLLTTIISGLPTSQNGRQADALHDIRRAMHIR